MTLPESLDLVGFIGIDYMLTCQLKSAIFETRHYWHEYVIQDYSTLLSKVAPIIEISKSHQIGRATEKVAYATFDFTEGWFCISSQTP